MILAQTLYIFLCESVSPRVQGYRNFSLASVLVCEPRKKISLKKLSVKSKIN